MTTTPANRVRSFLGAWQQRLYYDRDVEIAWQVDLTGAEHTLMVADLEAILAQSRCHWPNPACNCAGLHPTSEGAQDQ